MRVVDFRLTNSTTLMKKALLAALFTALLFAFSTPASAQTSKTKKMTPKKKSSSVKASTRATRTMDADDAAMTDNPVHSENTTDPLYLNHPYFNGEPRWTDADSLYKHGDFPWALVSKNPDNFRFNSATGNWEMRQTENLGKAVPSR